MLGENGGLNGDPRSATYTVLYLSPDTAGYDSETAALASLREVVSGVKAIALISKESTPSITLLGS